MTLTTLTAREYMPPMGRKKPVGGFRAIPIGARVKFEPQAATRELLEAVEASGANLNATAERLGISPRTLRRYMDELGIARQVHALIARARKEGWIKSARWPEKVG